LDVGRIDRLWRTNNWMAALASVTLGISLSSDEGLAVEASRFARMAATQDIRERIGAFLEHRAQAFSGR